MKLTLGEVKEKVAALEAQYAANLRINNDPTLPDSEREAASNTMTELTFIISIWIEIEVDMEAQEFMKKYNTNVLIVDGETYRLREYRRRE